MPMQPLTPASTPSPYPCSPPPLPVSACPPVYSPAQPARIAITTMENGVISIIRMLTLTNGRAPTLSNTIIFRFFTKGLFGGPYSPKPLLFQPFLAVFIFE